eukprot:s5427_g3.t1
MASGYGKGEAEIPARGLVVLLCGIPGCGKDAVGRACVRDFPEAAALSQDEHNGSADATRAAFERLLEKNASPIFVLRNGVDVGDRLPFLLPARSAGYRIAAAWPAELSQSADRKAEGRAVSGGSAAESIA